MIPKQFLAFDGLRGCLALMVVLEHISDTLSANFDLFVTQAVWGNTHFWGAFGPLAIVRNGALAVGIFFALSGFVLTHALYKSSNLLGKDFFIFATKRYVRFALPVLALHLLIWCAFALGIFNDNLSSHIIFNGFAPLLHPQLNIDLANVVFHGLVSTPILGTSFFNPVLWTVSVELYGSLLVLLLIASWHNKLPNPLRIVLSVLTTSTVLVIFHQTFFVGFVAGAATYMLIVKIKPRFLATASTKWALVTLCLILMLHSAKGGETNPFNLMPLPMHSLLHYVYYSLAGCCIITLLAVSPHPNRFLISTPMRYLGQRSFSLYLVHYLVIQTVGLDLRDYVATETIAGIAVYLLLIVSISMLISELFYRGVERPCISGLKRLQLSMRDEHVNRLI